MPTLATDRDPAPAPSVPHPRAARVDITDPNPFRQAAAKVRAAAATPGLPHTALDRLRRQAEWHEQEAARWDARHSVASAPQDAAEPLPQRVPGAAWLALTGARLDTPPRPPTWAPDDRVSFSRLLDA
jgi:hypothetical protein